MTTNYYERKKQKLQKGTRERSHNLFEEKKSKKVKKGPKNTKI